MTLWDVRLKGEPCHIAPLGLWVMAVVTCGGDDVSMPSMVVCDGFAYRYVFCSKQEAASLEFSSCLCIFYVRKIFFNSYPAVFLSLLHVVKKKYDWGYFQIPKSPAHIQLSPSVNYSTRYNDRDRKRERKK